MTPEERAKANAAAGVDVPAGKPVGDQVSGGPIGAEVGQPVPADVPINGAVPSDEETALEMGTAPDPSANTDDGENAP